MACIILFTSTQACAPVLNLALNMQRENGHQLRTLGQLPPPRPVRVASLRLELAALLQDERTLRWTLSQYALGLRLPDACREEGLRADLDMTRWRIEVVTASLNEIGGLSHD